MTQGTIVRNISYTADGNTLQDNFGTGTVFAYGYNNDNRMVQASLNGATQASYTVNYLGQRVIKSAAGPGTTHFHYDRSGHLVAESDGSGNVLREYVFLGDTPVAFISASGIDIIHTDHLGTPQKMTDAGQNIVWDGGASDPFMMSALPTTPAMNQRFPGQYFDGETGLHYNYFRDYDPTLGRYVESDPIGLRAGMNTYAYLGGMPVAFTDRLGLATDIIITYDSYAGGYIDFGSHSAVHIDNGGDPELYDPAGSYDPPDESGGPSRGSDDTFTGDNANLDAYLRYQRSTGSTVRVYHFDTNASDESKIAKNIDAEGGKDAPYCTIGVTNVLMGVGPFKDLHSHFFPGALEKIQAR